MTAYIDCKPGRTITRYIVPGYTGASTRSGNAPICGGQRVVWDVVGAIRQCSRSACRQSAVATLTYVYADSTAVLGPLATYAEPHCYDLCEQHAGSLTVPRGWEVLRLAMPTTPQQPGPDDLLALANAVRDAAALPAQPPSTPAKRGPHSALEAPAGAEGTRRGHLRVLREPS
jgi:hypothetical protein